MGMKRALAAAATIFALNVSAEAASAYSWTGFYVGGYTGYAWGETKATDIGDAVANPWYVLGSKFSTKPDSFVIGATAGYNYQFGNWLAGIESDVGSFRVRGTGLYHAGGDDTFVTAKPTYDVTLRARLGAIAGPSLFYLTGGALWANFNASVFDVSQANTTGSTGVQAGWIFGGGWEYAIDPRWSFKTEYLHYQTGSEKPDIGGTGYRFDIKSSGDIVRVGFNYKFGN